MFANLDDFDLKVALHYDDHPISAINDDLFTLNVGTVTLVRVSIEEVICYLGFTAFRRMGTVLNLLNSKDAFKTNFTTCQQEWS